MKKAKYIISIVILAVLLALAIAYIVLGPNGYEKTKESSTFFDDVIELQSTLSYYVGSAYSDAFGVYTKTEILSGVTEDGDKIKDNEDNVLPALISTNDAIDYKGDEKAYKLNMDNVKVTLGIDTSKYDGVTFYVVEGDILKVKLDSTPEWWDSNFDSLKI